jgi:hypothetical protein
MRVRSPLPAPSLKFNNLRGSSGFERAFLTLFSSEVRACPDRSLDALNPDFEVENSSSYSIDRLSSAKKGPILLQLFYSIVRVSETTAAVSAETSRRCKCVPVKGRSAGPKLVQNALSHLFNLMTASFPDSAPVRTLFTPEFQRLTKKV